jgi:hypothetical protein
MENNTLSKREGHFVAQKPVVDSEESAKGNMFPLESVRCTLFAMNRRLADHRIRSTCRELMASGARLTGRGLRRELRERYGAVGQTARVFQIWREESAASQAPAVPADVAQMAERLHAAETAAADEQSPSGAGRAARGSPSNALGHGNRRPAAAVAGSAPIRRRDSQTPRPGHATYRRTPRRSPATGATGVTRPTGTPAGARRNARRPHRVVERHRRRRDHSRGKPTHALRPCSRRRFERTKESAHSSPTLPPSPVLRNAKGRGTKSLSQE